MADIVHDRTWCRFVDDAGVEWDVMDLIPRRASAGDPIERPPGDARAIGRIFRRFTPLYGSQKQRLVEERRYRFEPADSRWTRPELFQLQFEMSIETTP
jgi:hypothetical protein